MADALKAHIERCPQHPMSALKAESERLRDNYNRLTTALRFQIGILKRDAERNYRGEHSRQTRSGPC
jgi:hypothetical protein